MNQSSLHRDGLDSYQVFVKNMQFEVSAYDKIQIVLLTVGHAGNLVRSGFFEKIHHKKLFTSLLGPNMNLLLVVTNESFGVRIEKYIFDTLRTMLLIFCRKLKPEFYSQTVIVHLLFKLLRVHQLSFLLQDDLSHLLNFLTISFIH